MPSSASRAERMRAVSQAATRFVAAAHLARHDRGRAAGLSLHSVDATILDLLGAHGPLTPRELARRAGISSSGTITGAIDRLEGAGWTTRTPCQVDRRKVFIALTDAGREHLDPGVEKALEQCTDAQLAALGHLLERLP